jgi:hypothetical protein
MEQETHSDKPIFETFNWYKSFWAIIARLFCLGVVISAAVNFKENPIATTLAIIVFGFLFLVASPESVVVYHDRFEYKPVSFFNLLKRNRTYYYKDIKSFSIDGIGTLSFDMIAYAIPHGWVLGRNKIYIDFKDGKAETIWTWIYKGDLSKAMKYVLEAYVKYNNSHAYS